MIITFMNLFKRGTGIFIRHKVSLAMLSQLQGHTSVRLTGFGIFGYLIGICHPLGKKKKEQD